MILTLSDTMMSYLLSIDCSPYNKLRACYCYQQNRRWRVWDLLIRRILGAWDFIAVRKSGTSFVLCRGVDSTKVPSRIFMQCVYIIGVFLLFFFMNIDGFHEKKTFGRHF